MRVLVFHGYLLRGTGSNVYNANLAAALVRLGHEVHLLCQERAPAELEFVGAVGDWDTGKLRLNRIRDAPCTVYRPSIGRLLPVYVYDRYQGVQARPFEKLTEAELDAYLLANERAVAEVAARSRPEVALANHLVMGPAILARALRGTGVPFAAKVHGSALEYTVKPHPRFLPYAREGVAGARCVLVGSRHTAQSLWTALEEPWLPGRTRLGPPGADVTRFRPLQRAAATQALRSLTGRIADDARGVPADSSFARDHIAAAAALDRLVTAADSDRLVAFVGKLIVAKGIDLLLAAWPLVLAEVPAARLVVVGFGAYRQAAERLRDALADGNLEAVAQLARQGTAAEGGPTSRLRYLTAFLEQLAGSGRQQEYVGAASALRDRVVFAGRLEHDELAELLPLCEAIVVPSTFPEAFGMVAVEAAACGALPISAAHSGLAEVSSTLAPALPEPVRALVSFPLGSDVVTAIAGRVVDWLALPRTVREAARAAVAQTVRERYSWESVARGVIAAARGELDQLPAP
jgi:glycosyltransferase involved in cell wall biosynthesis